MGKRQFILGIILASLMGGFIALVGYNLLNKGDQESSNDIEQKQQVVLSSFGESYKPMSKAIVPEGLNFVNAAKVATQCVVHIKSVYDGKEGYASRNPLYEYFGFGNPESRKSRATGSGVLISSDGYIVTNNHVIEGATEVQVTLNSNEKYEASVIGSDPDTDLALVKIDDSNLPHINFGNSDVLEIGEWVLAVGNPFDLTSTVTAGILSAKARNINILNTRSRIESFLQTDAVVNPGNSGGALVNLNGELVGINTAIASPTGSYTGYSFAVPVTLVKKVVNDLKEYGEVQRALLGIDIANLDDPRIGESDLDLVNGIYVLDVTRNSGAEDAGLQRGDIITKIDNEPVNNMAELQEKVARNRVGTKIEVTYQRNHKIKTVTATLKNRNQQFDIIKKVEPLILEGATFEELDGREKSILEIDGGVKISDLHQGKWSDAGIKAGFIVTNIDKERVTDVNQLKEILKSKDGNITVFGKYPDGSKDYYSLNW